LLLTGSSEEPQGIAPQAPDGNPPERVGCEDHPYDKNDAGLSPSPVGEIHRQQSVNTCRVCCHGMLVYDGGDVVCTACGAVDDEQRSGMQHDGGCHPSSHPHMHGAAMNNIWSITRSGNGTALLTRDEKEKLGLQTGAYRHTLRSPEEKVVKIIDRVCDRNNLALPESLVKEAVYWATKITNELASKRSKNDQVRIKVSPAEISIFSIRKACKTSGISCSTQRLVEAHRRLGYSNIADKKILRNLRRISFVTGIKYETLAPRDYVFNLTNCLISDEGTRSRLANIANPLDYIERRIYSRALEILADIRGEGRNNVMVAAAAICIADRIEGEALGPNQIAKTLHLDKYKLTLAVEHILNQMREGGKVVKFRANPAAEYRSQVSSEFARFRQRWRPDEEEPQSGDNLN
jgi:transcription initiation factor TFIIIB Brf1 subunit/transcription initiation factor TFIIB